MLSTTTTTRRPSGRRATLRGASLLGAAVTALALVAGIMQPTAAYAATYATDRIAGPDRYTTSEQIIGQMEGNRQVHTLYTAAGHKFPDALAAAPVAYNEDARLVLNTTDELLPSTLRVLRNSRLHEVVIIGGPTTLSDAVAREAGARSPGAVVTRIAGADRVLTSLALHQRMAQRQRITDVWITDGRNFSDSLTVSTIAAREGHAVVLAHGDPATWMRDFRATVPASTRIHIAGGPTSVSPVFETLLRQRHASVERIAGADRWETSYLLNKAFPPA